MRGCTRVIVATGVLVAAAMVRADAADLDVAEPRAFGYQIGDMLERRIVLRTTPQLPLDLQSLPVAGRRGQAIELRALRRDERREGDEVVHDIVLTYQVFHAPVEVTTLEIAPFTLRLADGEREQTLRVDAWPVTVAPLLPLQVSPRAGLGEWRPDAQAPLLETSAYRTRLVAYAALALPLLGWLAHVYLGVPWGGRRRQPFARAWRAMRRADDDVQALHLMHEAINRAAGRTVLARDVDGFVAAQPRYAPARAALQAFFARSQQALYAGAAPPPRADVVALCRHLRDLERGAA